MLAKVVLAAVTGLVYRLEPFGSMLCTDAFQASICSIPLRPALVVSCDVNVPRSAIPTVPELN